MIAETDDVRIEPVVEAPWFDGSPPWPWPIAAVPAFKHFRIHGDMTPEETGSLVAALTDPIDVEAGTSAQEIFRQLSQLDYFSLAGGLAISVHGELVITLGCCSGLESWREWWTIQDRKSPWMGHDPTPWCQFLDNGMVRFWRSGGFTSSEIEPHVDVSMERIADLLNRVHDELTAVLQKLASWLRAYDCTETEILLSKFDRSFAISTMRPAYLDSD